MDTTYPQENQSAKVLALGGLAAGVVGSLYVLLTEREKKPKTRMEVARQTLEDAAAQARKQATTLETGVASSLHDARGRMATKGKQTKKEARKRGRRAGTQAKREADHSRDRMITMFQSARDKGVDTLHEIEKHSPDVVAMASQMLGKTEEKLGSARHAGGEKLGSAKQAGTARAHIGMRKARAARKDARKEARRAQGELVSLVERAKEKAPEARQYVESHVVPQVQELRHQAAGAIEQGRGRAEELVKHAEKDVVPQVKDAADRLKHRVEEQAKVAASVVEKGSAEAAHRLADTTTSVETHAKGAGTAVARGGREFRSLVVWLALGATLIYSVFLNEEQKAKVREMAKSLFGEAKGIYGDIKGQNGTFEQA
jgi:F0F1-type ATP synthase membrane subunit b/b'